MTKIVCALQQLFHLKVHQAETARVLFISLSAQVGAVGVRCSRVFEVGRERDFVWTQSQFASVLTLRLLCFGLGHTHTFAQTSLDLSEVIAVASRAPGSMLGFRPVTDYMPYRRWYGSEVL